MTPQIAVGLTTIFYIFNDVRRHVAFDNMVGFGGKKVMGRQRWKITLQKNFDSNFEIEKTIGVSIYIRNLGWKCALVGEIEFFTS